MTLADLMRDAEAIAAQRAHAIEWDGLSVHPAASCARGRCTRCGRWVLVEDGRGASGPLLGARCRASVQTRGNDETAHYRCEG